MGDADETTIARALGRLEGTVAQGFDDLGRRMKAIETSFHPWPAVVSDLQHRVEILEQGWAAGAEADARMETARMIERRWFWGRVVTIISALVDAAVAVYLSRGGH